VYAPDLVRRNFNPAGPDQLWAADVTQFRTGQGWLYLATVIDLWSRRVIGWSTGTTPNAELVSAALVLAATRRQPRKGVVHHSDRGAAYTSISFSQRVIELELDQSFGRVGDCYDKAMVSYCTPLRWWGVSAFGQAGAHLFDESGVTRRGQFEEADVLVVGLMGCEQAGLVPGLDGGWMHVEVFGEFGDGEQAA
jgi:hypothetical protein